VEIIFRQDLDDEQKIAERELEYTEQFANPFRVSARGYIDDVIMPSGTRGRVIRALRMLKNKEQQMPAKKHGNIPL
jgi:propionyl-CoA carboxylase beta chain